jgi:hypothetical protein
MSNIFMSEFMEDLKEKLKEQRNLSDPSVKLYIRQLTTLNNNESFKNLNFLKKVDDILDKLKNYKENTKKSYLSAIEAVLSLFKKNKLYETYKKLLDEKIKDYKEKDKNEINEEENKNWVSSEEIQEIKENLLKGISNKKNITSSEWNKLLRAFLISLYTDLPPRRNQDYLLCFIVRKEKKGLNNDVNYLILNEDKFVFNKFKTSKSSGKQEINFKDNENFKSILNLYLSHHPLLKSTKGMVPLLVDDKGVPPSSPNWITRILNKTFKKKVGSSMLRKIYLTTKYGDELDKLKEMRNDSIKMGNSVGTQQAVYIKNL